MITIAMLHYRKNPEKVKRAYACAAVAKMEGYQFFYFSPKKVNFEKRVIRGFLYREGAWIKKKLPFPDVIYNAAPMKTEAQKRVYRRLKEEIPFTSHPVGSKMKVYRKIKSLKEFSPYLLPSEKVINAATVFDFLTLYKKVVVKPFSGNHGKSVLRIAEEDAAFTITDQGEKKTVTKRELASYLESLIKEKDFLVQPFVRCETKEGLPYDFRVHVQKDGEGNWGVTLIYPRIGRKGEITSNVSGGGFIGKLDSFLKKEHGEDHYQVIKNQLETFANRFPAQFDALYDHSLDELGIDVALDDNGMLWIYEVNWRPGYTYRELDAAKRTIPYAAYLVKQNRRP